MTGVRRLLPWVAMAIPAWWILRESPASLRVDLPACLILFPVASAVSLRSAIATTLSRAVLTAFAIALLAYAVPSSLLGIPAGERAFRAEEVVLVFIVAFFAYQLSAAAHWARAIPPALLILLAATMALSGGSIEGPADTVLGAALALLILIHLACATHSSRDPRLAPSPRPPFREIRIAAWLFVPLTLAVLGMPAGDSRLAGDGGMYRQGLEPVTGFSEDLDLSKMGLLKSSDARSLIARFSTGGRPWTEDDFWEHRQFPILMRGSTFGDYRNGRFVASREREVRFPEKRDPASRGGWVRFEQELFMAPHGSVHLFAQGEVVSASEGVMLAGGMLKARSVPQSPFAYRAVSYAFPEAARPDLRTEAIRHPDERYLARLPLGGRMRREASDLRQLLKGATPLATVEKLEAWFRHDGGFRYTRLNENDPRNPIESFLLDTKAGHCAFFAAAMVAILREWGIPARVAGGLRGGAFSTRMNAVVFLQRDAHAWVEVPFASSGWIAFDPTPGEERLDALLPAAGEDPERGVPGGEAGGAGSGPASARNLEADAKAAHDRGLYPWLALCVLLIPLLAQRAFRWFPARTAGIPQQGSSEGDRLDQWFRARGTVRPPGKTRRETLSGMTGLESGEAALALGIIEDLDRLRFSGEGDSPSLRRDLRCRIDLLAARGRRS